MDNKKIIPTSQDYQAIHIYIKKIDKILSSERIMHAVNEITDPQEMPTLFQTQNGLMAALNLPLKELRHPIIVPLT